MAAITALLNLPAITPTQGIAQVQKKIPAMGVSEYRCFLALLGYVEKLAAALGVVNGKKVLDLDVLAAIIRAVDDPNSKLSKGEKQWLAHEHLYQGFLELLIEFTNPARKGAAFTFSMQQRLRQRFFKWLKGASNLPHWKELKTARWAKYEKFFKDRKKETPYKYTVRDSVKLDYMLEVVQRYLAATGESYAELVSKVVEVEILSKIAAGGDAIDQGKAQVFPSFAISALLNVLSQGAQVGGWLHQALLTGFSHIREDSSTMRNGGAITFATANIASAIDVLKKEMNFTSAQTDAFLSGEYVYRRFRILIWARLVNLGQYESGFDCFHRALSKSVDSDRKQRGIDPVESSKWTKPEIDSLIAWAGVYYHFEDVEHLTAGQLKQLGDAFHRLNLDGTVAKKDKHVKRSEVAYRSLLSGRKYELAVLLAEAELPLKLLFGNSLIAHLKGVGIKDGMTGGQVRVALGQKQSEAQAAQTKVTSTPANAAGAAASRATISEGKRKSAASKLKRINAASSSTEGASDGPSNSKKRKLQ